MKTKKGIRIWLIVALALCFISMIGTSVIQSNFGKTQVHTFYGSVTDVANMIRDNNQKYGKNIQVTFSENANADISFMTLKPNNATNENPAPAVICFHGGSNSKEMQMNGYIELARRGFVVISLDLAGHGYSDVAVNALTGDSFGGLAVVEYAMSLPYVDETRIGVTGHSLGNQGCFYSVAQTNIEGYPNPRIAAWVEGAGTMFASQVTPEMLDGLIWTVVVNKYDEFDLETYNSYHFLNEPLAVSLIQKVMPEFGADHVDEDVFYTAEGKVDAPNNGEQLNADTAITVLNPDITHPMFHFTNLGTSITINGFYNAFGVPDGANYIGAEQQIWPICVAFEFLGLIGFFALLFPLASILVGTKFFAGMKRDVVQRESLVSVKHPSEIIIWILTSVALIAFSFASYVKDFPLANERLDISVYAMSQVPNGVGYWSFICGVFVIAVILVAYAVRKLCAIRNKTQIMNPFEVARIDNFGQLGKSVLFAAALMILMFIPVIIARYVFNADFRICSFVVGVVSIDKLPLIICKYLPLWLVFYIPNAIMNANTRYKEMPEWVTTTICALINSLSLVIFLFIQYGTLFTQGKLWSSAAGMAGIVAFAVIPCLFYAAFSARYIYKRTGNIWAAGITNGALMCFVSTFVTRYMSDLVLPF